VRVGEANWFRLEEYLRGDDRIVLPLGSTEQHAYLSLATDSILAERSTRCTGRASGGSSS
jgi:creatinine amidohydrolase